MDALTRLTAQTVLARGLLDKAQYNAERARQLPLTAVELDQAMTLLHEARTNYEKHLALLDKALNGGT